MISKNEKLLICCLQALPNKAFLKSENPNVIIFHCVTHRQHLVAKNISGRLNQSLKTVIKTVNKIKVHALNTRLFKQLCNKKDEAFKRLFLHTKERWLSKGNCLARFNLLFDTVMDFCRVAILVLLIRNDSAYLLDIFAKFNELNLSLQRNKINLIKVKSALPGFNNNLTPYSAI